MVQADDAIDEPLIVGIAGGSGSGKTTLMAALQSKLGTDAVVLRHDDYYHCLAHLPADERARRNFDAPESLDTKLLCEHLRRLRMGTAVSVPQYDFSQHVRRAETVLVESRRVVLLDGILLFHEAELRELCTLRVFVDAHEEVRFARRRERDARERGRSEDSIVQQWHATVKPMHDQYVEPSKRHAHLIVPMHEPNELALELLWSFVSNRQRER